MTALVRHRLADADLAALIAADERRERWRMFGLCLPALLTIGCIVLLPIGWLFWLSFIGPDGSPSLENYAAIWNSGTYFSVIRRTFEISFIVAGICALLGYPLAYFLSELPRRAANICMITVILPYMTSVLVRTYAWLVLLQYRGLVNDVLVSSGIIDERLPLVHNFTGTVIGMVHILLPFLVLPLYASMKAIDRNYLKAAANLGAPAVAVFWRVFFPLSLPGLMAGVFLVFVLSLGFFVTPAILGGGRVIMMAQQIATAVTIYAHWGAASAVGIVLLAVTVAVLYLASRVVRADAFMR